MKLEKRSTFGWPATRAGYAPCLNGLVVHYDGNDQGLAGKKHSACRDYWKRTRKFHMNGNGWLDIGYSFGVCPHGIILEGRGWQREQAAQPSGNTTWTSVTFMSGPSEKPTAEQVEAFRALRKWLRGKGLKSGLRGHRDFYNTSCPGSILYSMVKNGSLTKSPSSKVEAGSKAKPTTKAQSKVKAPTFPGVYLEYPPLRYSAACRTWQAQMKWRGWRLAVDGLYGPRSKEVCKAFQKEKGLMVDGIVGPQTWKATWEAPVT